MISLSVGYNVLQNPCLRGDAEPVDIGPSAVVGPDGGTGAEGAHLGAYPFAFARPEGSAQWAERPAVGAVAEVAGHEQVVPAFALGYLPTVAPEPDAQIDGTSGQSDRCVDLLGLSLVGTDALHLRQGQSVGRVFEHQRGIVHAHHH